MPTIRDIRPGDKVTIQNERGTQLSGQCVMACSTHAVLNLGGRHGTPGVTTPDNIVEVKKRKR